MIELGGTLIVALLAYCAAVLYAHHYGRDWAPPEGTAQSNWKLRHDIGVTLGAVAVAICAIVCTLFISSWVGRIVTLAQAVILASAGASDVRKFHLPLPLTMMGLCLAIITLMMTKTPMLIVMFGLIWAAALIALHAALSKGSMQLGDHLATLWIALAMPFNGMVAVILGDFANVGVARMKSLKGKKVAAAGAWLIFAAALVGLPPYYALYQNFRKAAAVAPAFEVGVMTEVIDAHELAQAYVAQDATPDTEASAETQPVAAATPDPNAQTLLDVMALARYETGRLAMIDQRAERIRQARRASTRVARLAAIAAQRGGSRALVEILSDLSHSLAAYDVDGVQAASADLANTYDALEAKLAEQALLKNSSEADPTDTQYQASQDLPTTSSETTSSSSTVETTETTTE